MWVWVCLRMYVCECECAQHRKDHPGHQGLQILPHKGPCLGRVDRAPCVRVCGCVRVYASDVCVCACGQVGRWAGGRVGMCVSVNLSVDSTGTITPDTRASQVLPHNAPRLGRADPTPCVWVRMRARVNDCESVCVRAWMPMRACPSVCLAACVLSLTLSL